MAMSIPLDDGTVRMLSELAELVTCLALLCTMETAHVPGRLTPRHVMHENFGAPCDARAPIN
jgi:hypothetical protein